MARVLDFSGFEVGDLSGWSGASGSNIGPVGDGTARTGEFHLRVQYPVGVAANGNIIAQLVTPNIPYPGVGVAFKVLVRAYVRLRERPTFEFGLVGWGDSGFAFSGLSINSAGRLGIRGTSATFTGPTPPLDQWFKAEVSYSVPVHSGAFTTTVGVSVLLADGTAWTTSVTFAGFSLSSTWKASLGHPYGNTLNYVIEWDDVVAVYGGAADAAALALPVGDRVSALPATGAGAQQAWTGSWQQARKRPKGGSSGALTTSTNNAQVTFDHPTVDSLGLEPYTT